MKKIFVVCISLFLSLMVNIPAFATSASLSFSGDSTIEGSGSATITLSVFGVSGLDGICGVSGKLSYDSSKITLSGASSTNGFTLTQGSQYVAYKSTCINKGGIFSLTFKNKGLSDGGSATISFSGIKVSSASEEISASNISKTITYRATKESSGTSKKNSSKNSNKEKEVNKDGKKEVNKDNEKEESSKSNDSSLSEIVFSVGKINFLKDTFNYDLIVSSDVNYIEVNAKTTDSGAEISGVGKYDLTDEKTEIKLVVKAEDGSESVYYINVIKDVMESVQTQEKSENNLVKNIAMVIAILAVAFSIVMFFVMKKAKKKAK